MNLSREMSRALVHIAERWAGDEAWPFGELRRQHFVSASTLNALVKRQLVTLTDKGRTTSKVGLGTAFVRVSLTEAGRAAARTATDERGLARKQRIESARQQVLLATVTKPTVHLNGTDRATLLVQLTGATTALHAAHDALREAAPHERDYYVSDDPEAYRKASREHRDRLERLSGVLAELIALRESVR
jgi:hypothetical protein